MYVCRTLDSGRKSRNHAEPTAVRTIPKRLPVRTHYRVPLYDTWYNTSTYSGTHRLQADFTICAERLKAATQQNHRRAGMIQRSIIRSINSYL